MEPVQLQFHEWHSRDPVAMIAYRDAIRAIVRAGDVVVDIGAGAGILSLQACAAGAARVYAVESTDIVYLIPRISAENGLMDRIVACKGFSFEVGVPEPADVLILSMLDCFGVDNNLVGAAIDSRRRMLKAGGSIIPASLDLSFCPVELASWYNSNIDCWNSSRFGFEFAAARAIAVHQQGTARISKSSLLAPPHRFDKIDLASVESNAFAATATFEVSRSGTIHALAGWFEATLAEGIRFSNSPLDDASLPWAQRVFPIEHPIEVRAGDRVGAWIEMVEASNRPVWIWGVSVKDPATNHRTEYRHSTFYGMLFDTEDLKTRGSANVPTIPSHAAAYIAAIELCDGERSLGQIAEQLSVLFASTFPTPGEAQVFAASVLGRASRPGRNTRP